FLCTAAELLRKGDPEARLRGHEVPHQGLALLQVLTNFFSRPGVGFDESTSGQNHYGNAFRSEKRMRENLHWPAQAKAVVFCNYSFRVQDSAKRLLDVRQQPRNSGEVDHYVESGARHILLVIEYTAIVAVPTRFVIEMYLQGTAVDCTSIPHEIEPFRNCRVHF